MLHVNGLRPQNNCNVCNTGDIRINGLTMVTIDGMPIVSALGTVYGLSGIPNLMINRIEVVKGAAHFIWQ
jgi:outer membrane receptor for ferrienterochelin and colicins